MQFRDRSGKALLRQFGNRFVQRRGFKRPPVRLDAIGPVGFQCFPCFQPQSSLTRADPNSEICHPGQLIERDGGQIPKSGHNDIEQRAEDSRS